ncbi:hypothetical protein BC829DRAFT_391198 [Chytridium lagenaria]|nr:hypothetical protein BC829DRAFT_391198 [Chytridium lagenaria]
MPVSTNLPRTFLLVSAHGFFYSPNGNGEPGAGSTRSYNSISLNIDTLRSPSNGLPMCRGHEASSELVPVSFGPSGSTHTVTLAYSIGAQHPGPCSIEIVDPATGVAVNVASVDGPQGCARPPTAFGAADTNKLRTASEQCGVNGLPRQLRTDDMCLFYWTFRLQNVERISCSRCIMRWTWVGTHAAEPELYENCIDINLSVNGGGPLLALIEAGTRMAAGAAMLAGMRVAADYIAYVHEKRSSESAALPVPPSLV